MSRGFSSAQAAALAQQHVSLVTFAKLEFPSGTVYGHDSIGTYTWGGQDWLGVGDLASISTVEEGFAVSPYALTLTVSGLDSTISGAALTEDYFMHGLTVYLGVLDEDDVLVGSPFIIWAGFMDQMNLTVGAEGDAIQIIGESELARFNKSRNQMYTNANQQERSSTDVFFKHLHEIEGAKIKWGSRTPGGDWDFDGNGDPIIEEYH
jgi:hypothetical protein